MFIIEYLHKSNILLEEREKVKKRGETPSKLISMDFYYIIIKPKMTHLLSVDSFKFINFCNVFNKIL